MKLPELTHLQFLILRLLGPHEHNGEYVRKALRLLGLVKNDPAFYQLMSRLESSKLIVGRYVRNGNSRRERHYRIAANGTRLLEQSKDFYRWSR